MSKCPSAWAPAHAHQVPSLRAVRRRVLAGSGLALLATLGAGTAHAQAALPAGGAVASGSATIATGPGTVTVTQTTGKAIVNWDSFDVGAANSVTFVQPDAGSATLNRVTGTTSSTVAGKISANGAVYLVNPNGIAITASGKVRAAGGFVASTLDIADSDFNAGNLTFKGKGGSAGVSNAGTITASQGAYVALLGGSVSNSGTINVALGKVGLGSGERIALDLNGDGFLQVAVPTSTITGGNDALIEMAGSIATSGGRVELRAATVKDAVRNVINLSGTISADNAVGDGGTIILMGGDGGTVRTSGTLSARAIGATGNGGLVETSGATIDFTGLKVDTRSTSGKVGTWLVDPSDLTVDAAAAATISSNLATSNVTLQTNSDGTTSGPGNTSSGAGDITIASAITWTSANTLSLLAYHNIAINAPVSGINGTLSLSPGSNQTVTATASIALRNFTLTNGFWVQNSALLPDFVVSNSFSASNFLRVTGGNGTIASPYQIVDVFGLQGITTAGTQANSFVLARDIDASGTATWNSGQGFVPISGFGGIFDGASHVISGLTINRGVATGVGLFGTVTGSAAIRNLGLTNAAVTGGDVTGGLVGGGSTTPWTIQNSYVTGRVSGRGNTGGMVGRSGQLAISNSHSTAAVTGNGSTGGLIGQLFAGSSVTTSYATGDVSNGTSSGVGGLIGLASIANGNQVPVTYSYASGNVTSASGFVGGLIGTMSNVKLEQVYATGNVSSSSTSATSGIGGLVGNLSTGSIVNAAYATGNVTSAGGVVGGFAGLMGGTISNVYASGKVSGASTNVGGLAGFGVAGAVTNSYWDSFSTGKANGFGNGITEPTVTSVSSATPSGSAYQASAYGNFTAASGIGTATPAGWVFMPGNSTRPFLAFEVPTAALSGTNGSGQILVTNSHQLQLIGYDGARLSGSYALTGSIDLSDTLPGTRPGSIWSTLGFVPIGTDGAGNTWGGTDFRLLANITSGIYGFTGSLDGTGFMLSNLSINRATIKNVGLFGVSSGTLSGITVGGKVTGSNGVGGLVGALRQNGSITGSSSSVITTGINLVGGLVGNQSDTTTISGSFATGKVSGTDDIGGLVGYSSGGTIARSYATGQVSGSHYVGGLVGYQYLGGVSDSYATGAVSASVHSAGGLIGKADTTSVTNSYSTGAVSAPGISGGLIGQGAANTVTSSYWDMQTSGQATSAGGAGRTTAQMQDSATYIGWDFTNTWSIISNNYPRLRTTP